MKNFQTIIKTGFILFCVTAIAALLLAMVNRATAPVIEINQQKRTQEAMKVVMSDADSFDKTTADGEGISEVYIAKNSSGKEMGKCVVSEANGYGGAVQILVGIDIDNKVTGIQIMSHAETPGLGANATKPEFYKQYNGKTFGIGVAKQNPKGNEIQAMSGATITSKAVTDAVNLALEFARGGDM